MADYDVFEIDRLELECGQTLRPARLAYTTYGRLNAEGTNVVLYPTHFGGTHLDNEFLIGTGRALDPSRYFIVVPNLFGNGISSSPSNTPPPYDRARFPQITVLDNVRAQERLLRERFGIRRIALAVGWSMAALQIYQWACLYPGCIDRLAPIAGSARCSVHNFVFLEGVKAALTCDPRWCAGWYESPPDAGLRAVARVWAGWALSQTFYRKRLYLEQGYSSLEDYLVNYWESMYLASDANNLLAMIWTWQHADISDNKTFSGDYAAALGAITARTFVMPGQTDMYFPPEDSEIEVKYMSNAELRIIPSQWGHYAGGGRNDADVAFLDENLRVLLAHHVT